MKIRRWTLALALIQNTAEVHSQICPPYPLGLHSLYGSTVTRTAVARAEISHTTIEGRKLAREAAILAAKKILFCENRYISCEVDKSGVYTDFSCERGAYFYVSVKLSNKSESASKKLNFMMQQSISKNPAEIYFNEDE